jgi:acetyltransferase-like isoleucine patch superfamily enzyme
MIIVNKLIRMLGRGNYRIDSKISLLTMSIIIFQKMIQLFRGLLYKYLFKEQKGLLFLGSKTKIKFKHKIKIGRSMTIGDNVTINALSVHGVSVGNNVSILDNTIIECTGVLNHLGEGISIGDNVGISQNCFIQVRGKVSIGNNVIFGPGVSIFSENHIFDDPNIPIAKQGVVREDVFIEDGSWIGAKATILSGVTVGKNSVVAAGSVVNKNVPPYTVVGGIPAKIIKHIKVGQ